MRALNDALTMFLLVAVPVVVLGLIVLSAPLMLLLAASGRPLLEAEA